MCEKAQSNLKSIKNFLTPKTILRNLLKSIEDMKDLNYDDNKSTKNKRRLKKHMT